MRLDPLTLYIPIRCPPCPRLFIVIFTSAQIDTCWGQIDTSAVLLSEVGQRIINKLLSQCPQGKGILNPRCCDFSLSDEMLPTTLYLLDFKRFNSKISNQRAYGDFLASFVYVGIQCTMYPKIRILASAMGAFVDERIWCIHSEWTLGFLPCFRVLSDTILSLTHAEFVKSKYTAGFLSSSGRKYDWKH